MYFGLTMCLLPPQCVSATCSPVSVKSGDRFIPTRAGSNWSINFHYANVSSLFTPASRLTDSIDSYFDNLLIVIFQAKMSRVFRFLDCWLEKISNSGILC